MINVSHYHICPFRLSCFSFLILTRDLKLDNTLINANGHVRVGDFGLATLSNGGKQDEVCGTCYYMAPDVSHRELFAFSNIPGLSMKVSRIKRYLRITPREKIIVPRVLSGRSLAGHGKGEFFLVNNHRLSVSSLPWSSFKLSFRCFKDNPTMNLYIGGH